MQKLTLIIGFMSLVITSCSIGNSDNFPVNSNICADNACDFNYSLSQNLIGTPGGAAWGPNVQPVFESSAKPYSSNINWQQNRILAAALYWVSQKHNYCHHHTPMWSPPFESNVGALGICSTAPNITESPSVIIRWNYSGTGAETAASWYSDAGLTGNYRMGLDCSDFTALLYNFGLSNLFTTGIALQGGQAVSESALAPNMPGFKDAIDSDTSGLFSAGQLVCADNTLAAIGSTYNGCSGHGGYISVFESNGTYNNNLITDQILQNLQPGDLIYIAGEASNPRPPHGSPGQQVTHVVMWTGQTVGNSSIIGNSMIAPQTNTDIYGSNHGQCSGSFWSVANNIGNWIIADSHYQGPDFRVFTPCFYRNQIWGVRRIIGAASHQPQVIQLPLYTPDARSRTLLGINVGGGKFWKYFIRKPGWF